jgi:hypothetical protein
MRPTGASNPVKPAIGIFGACDPIIFIEVCASACGLRANGDMGAGARFERRATVVLLFLRTPYLQPDCQEFR